jgi:hypothetical protein
MMSQVDWLWMVICEETESVSKLIFFSIDLAALGAFALLRGMQIFVFTEVVNLAYIYLPVVSLYRP